MFFSLTPMESHLHQLPKQAAKYIWNLYKSVSDINVVQRIVDDIFV